MQLPEVESAIAADFRSAAAATSFVGVLVPGASIKAVVREARRAVLYECDYDREARYHRKPPEGNSRPAGIARTHEARRKRGELAPYY